jgi:voltage-gated potassium channel
MYIVEGQKNGFENIFKSIYWAVVTLTTVGYGDVVPATVLGQFIASIVMIMGYGIIAVPTGIVTSSLLNNKNKVSTLNCRSCSKEGHEPDAVHCKFCGAILND